MVFNGFSKVFDVFCMFLMDFQWFLIDFLEEKNIMDFNGFSMVFNEF